MLRICEGNMWVGWWQTNVEEDRQTRMKQRKDGCVWDVGRLNAILQSRKQECAHPLPKARGGRQGASTCVKNEDYESLQYPDLTVYERVWMRQWLKALLLMRIWKSNHRLCLGKLGSAISNDTPPLHKTKANLLKSNRFEGKIQQDRDETYI